MYKKFFPGFAGPPYLGEWGSYLPGSLYYVTVGTTLFLFKYNALYNIEVLGVFDIPLLEQQRYDYCSMSYNPTELVTGYSYAPHSVFSTEDSTTRSSTMSSSTSGYSSTDSESTTKMTDTFSEKVRGSNLSSAYYSSASATQPVSQAQNSYMPSYLRDCTLYRHFAFLCHWRKGDIYFPGRAKFRWICKRLQKFWRWNLSQELLEKILSRNITSTLFFTPRGRKSYAPLFWWKSHAR